jgi:hypothetical protein
MRQLKKLPAGCATRRTAVQKDKLFDRDLRTETVTPIKSISVLAILSCLPILSQFSHVLREGASPILAD